MTEFFFINESDWLKFAEELAGGPVMCSNGTAMYDSLCFQRRTNAAALSALTMHMCAMVGAQNVWKDFVRDGLHAEHHSNKNDCPANDWKPS